MSALFQHAYPVEQAELRWLYENAKRDQWNVSRVIDWTQPVDLDRGVVADELLIRVLGPIAAQTVSIESVSITRTGDGFLHMVFVLRTQRGVLETIARRIGRLVDVADVRIADDGAWGT